MSRLLASLDAPPSGRFRPVWFDAVAYGRARLLGGGDLPWQAPAELTSFFGKTQAMFGADAADAVGALAATKGTVPLVLTVPAPGRWLAAAAAQAHPGAAPPEAGQA